MIYTELTVKALKISYNAHHGQTDISGVPYIFHPYHLAEQMDDEYSVCVALLHDVVEDTNVSITDLEKIFPNEITEAVKILTHESNVNYLDYIRKIKTNILARKVKLADLEHNSNETRIIDKSKISQEKLNYRRNKYTNALKLLKE